jgi:hypothetical protein
VYELQEAIDEGKEQTEHGTVREIVAWVRQHRRGAYAMNLETFAEEGFARFVRDYLKKKNPEQEEQNSQNLCFDFGLEDLGLDTTISVPEKDSQDLIYGKCRWEDINDITIEELDRHIAMLRAQAAYNLQKADAFVKLRQSVAKVAKGRMDLTIGELRKMSRRRN